MRIGIVTRRFRCDIQACPQRIFAERFEAAVLPARARRTARLDVLVYHLGLTLGGRPAASFARHLGLPVSNDTLLRLVRRRAQVPREPLKVVGIDDWAFRRNHGYGTLVCDLERRRVVSLLPDRETATSRLGSRNIPASAFWRAIVAGATARRRRAPQPLATMRFGFMGR